jgi:hypothetical protein
MAKVQLLKYSQEINFCKNCMDQYMSEVAQRNYDPDRIVEDDDCTIHDYNEWKTNLAIYRGVFALRIIVIPFSLYIIYETVLQLLK